jgi:hypothetical protein
MGFRVSGNYSRILLNRGNEVGVPVRRRQFGMSTQLGDDSKSNRRSLKWLFFDSRGFQEVTDLFWRRTIGLLDFGSPIMEIKLLTTRPRTVNRNLEHNPLNNLK